MTLTEYEQSLLTLPGFQRGRAASPALALREQIARGVGFAVARDAIAGQRQHLVRLQETNQLAIFTTLSGP